MSRWVNCFAMLFKKKKKIMIKVMLHLAFTKESVFIVTAEGKCLDQISLIVSELKELVTMLPMHFLVFL